MKRSLKILIICLCVLALVLTVLVFAQEIVGAYRDISFYWFDRTQTEIYVKQHAEEQGISYGEYPPSLIALLERNPETEEFVLGYPYRKKVDFDLSEYENSETVPLFIQWDQRWGYEEYGSDCIGITGCGPTCLAMVGFYLTGKEIFSPDIVAEFSQRSGYYTPGHGSSWQLISEGGPALGLDVTEIPLVKKRIVDNLEVGNPIICAVGPGDFTTSGHYIVLAGMKNGSFQVNDPNSYANSDRLWSYEELESQIRNLWVIRKGG